MRTVGVEEELLLVDPETGEPQARAAAMLARAAREGAGQEVFQKELHDEQVELATHPQSRMAELGAEIIRCRKDAARHAEGLGSAVAALATSPLPVKPTITVDNRYRWLTREFGLNNQVMLVCGCHVHVSVDSEDEGVAVLDRIRPWLSVLTALSANSPFWQGSDTLYASYRSQVWDRWPMAGPAEIFGSADRYHRCVEDLLATQIVRDQGMVYFDARLSPRYPTVEIRVADVCLHPDTTVLIASLTRGLVDTAAREWQTGVEPLGHSPELLRLATWRAARSGMSENLLDPTTMRPRPAVDVIRALLDQVEDALTDNGDLDRVHEALAELTRRGNGARVQREVLERTGSLRDVVAACVRHTQA
ncbi:glutamate--cysteine ligase 2 [Streptomyces ipomoeae]|uniref:Putative glutamate--cysteine ligase 2 n=1 Tax=Streptomyces ipomoeae 91-03 TaxID=698759 RepID=L1KNY2_9ACTN|nr:glutamate--cysteine ligase [Streptomyces ipomoeae]EKX62516.1 carboxylate-amine ligase, YbdK family [Streptomyces ipomoeae 91-03]MDX2696172.1 glutamate--cysteine ligase [Streptomyces ipomoeae]MDX2837735.1 glutamate--cysteine ligase [Streptomyces ipomoeae]TQE36986.1 YbdK family carboxylate-amine ligase [Streptomyces ipomoeae]